ncbi:unconventional myosin-XVIIIa-like isoform X3 [Brienomyrus brachyistius]|uniref:unconventional myosin-XVIIIa-like isoform X3 n=1 Tax=Brienomyrus brachyistius TaxID=42636 RepID=UPI0020B2B7D9|nr:unconventional myosin-XVIIIa-like isoform X3 [Brienomyrus brachyistius]XP_048853884.1 unconventional myosin-XVIIIa-like isoform X3 [Brienomyrus brachyistius]
MAFSSRFSFWERKVNDDAQPVTKDTGTSSSEGMSHTEPPPPDVQPVHKKQDPTDGRVLTSRGGEDPGGSARITKPPKVFGLSSCTEMGSDISAGLASLMGRGRTKEHRPRSRASDRRGVSRENVEDRVEEVQKPAEEQRAEEEMDAPSRAPAAQEDAPPEASPLQPPSGFIPAPRTLCVEKKPEVAPLTPTELAQRRLERIFTTPGGVDEDPVAVLQSAHSAASQSKVKTEEQIAVEKAWYSTEKVWLIHKDGFSLAMLLKSEEDSVPEGKVKIQLEHDGKVLVVDEDDVEKANPPACDRVEDLASLQYLNESSVVNSLRQRYGTRLIHTHAGRGMVVINPVSAPSMYSDKVMQMFKGCRREDSAPHIYGVAQAAYRSLLTTRQDQAIVLLGRSGGGKSTCCQHLVQYLAGAAGSATGKAFSVEKWQAANFLLEAFGNSGTPLNSNASRFSQIISLDFDQAGQVASASIQTMLLEKLRVARRPMGETTFNVFYYLMAGADSSLRTELHFNHFAESSAFGIMPHTKPEDKQKASQQFTKLQAAMKVLGISSEEQRAFWLVLGAIYHLGAAGASKAGRRQFARHEWGQKAAYLLGCSLEEISSAIFKHQPMGAPQRPSPASSSLQGPEKANSADNAGPRVSAADCLEVIASGLYAELFSLLIFLINRALKSHQHSLYSLMIVDTPGSQNPRLAEQARGGTFQELCHNYTQERLQALFQEHSVAQELERHGEENVELTLDDMETSPSSSVAVVDQPVRQTLVRTPAQADEARGLLWLMEEEALQPGCSEDALVRRLLGYYGPAEGDRQGHKVVLKGQQPHHFLLGHSHGTDWVEYDTRGWLGYAKQNPTSQNAAFLLQNSQKKSIRGLFVGRGAAGTALSGSIAGLEGVSQLAMRRATSLRKSFTAGMAAIKKRSPCFHVKLQVDALIDLVRRSRVHYVHCFLPFPDAAAKGRDSKAARAGEPEAQGESCEPGLMQLDVPLLRAQVRGSRLLDTLRIHRQGYPDHMVFSEFRRRFEVLVPHLSKKHGRHYIVSDEKRAVEELLESLDLEKSSHHMGLSRVLFRAGTLAKLEEQRDEQTRHNISLLQAACRGYLARQAFKKRKVQDLALRCIQKNIKKNRGVKDWPWWKLFTNVRPLVEVQLTEEQIRGRDEEIQQLKMKLEKAEKERNELRLSSERLESRVTELSVELADERSAGESASQMLETEAAERLRLDRDLRELQVKYDAVRKQAESMEVEVMEARLSRAVELNGDLDDDDDAGGAWRVKYERAVREADFNKKRHQQEFEDKLETEQQSRRHVERKLADLQADSDEAQRSLQQFKKKVQRLTSELQDTRLHLENQQSRNHELEKKQRRFDSEQSQALDEAHRERALREKLAREKDALTGELFSLRQQLQDKDVEACAARLKVEQLEAELADLSSQESKDEASLAKVKKQLRDLQVKVKDQEEELDEQAGTIQMLEQAKLRLEMQMERLRQTHAKEVESREEEVEEIRQTCSKKVKQMEVQLEEEYEEKQKILREKRELESKLLSAQDQLGQRDLETERRLRKDLKRTKVLLVDAQVMLEHLKNSAPSRREISQLKNQLEESEFTCAAAVKTRKSMELEMEDLHLQMDDVTRAKSSLEEQVSRLQREKNELQSRMEEDQEDLNELMKKQKAAVAQSARDLSQISDLQAQLEEAIKEKQEVLEKVQALQSQLEFQEQSMVDRSLVSRQEAKVRELETKLEYEKSQVKRLEGLVSRLKENMEKLTEERDQHVAAESREKEQNKRAQRQMRDLKEEMAELAKKEAEASRKKHELEMDVESLEAANQSLQTDLKLAFKRIGDLQAALEDEMESDDNDDLVNCVQTMVTKYQSRRSKTGDDSDMDSEVEDRVDGVKLHLSRSKDSSRTLSDDVSMKSPRYGGNSDTKEQTEAKGDVKKGGGEKPPKAAALPGVTSSSLSYRKRRSLRDTIGGTGDEASLLSALTEHAEDVRPSFRREATSMSRGRSVGGDDLDDLGSVISQAYTEASSRARTGLDRRWADSDRGSVVSSVLPSRTSAHLGLDGEADNRSTLSGLDLPSPRGLHRSSSWRDAGGSDIYGPRSGARSPGSVTVSSSLARSSRISEFGAVGDADSESASLSMSRASTYSPGSLGRSLSAPAAEPSGSRATSYRNYLDPELEAAINEVLSFKPIKFKRRSLEDSEEEQNKDEDQEAPPDHGKTSVLSRTSSSLAPTSRRSHGNRENHTSDSDNFSPDRRHSTSSRIRTTKSKKSSKRKETSSSSSSSTSSESSSSSSSSVVSYHSSGRPRKGSAHRASGSEDEDAKEQRKKKKKRMDNLGKKYLHRSDSD